MLEERLNAIKIAREKRNLVMANQLKEEQTRKENFLTTFENDKLSIRVKEIIEVAKELQKNGFLLGEKKSWDKAPFFVSDGINHGFGFVCEGNPYTSPLALQISGLGYEGGGCCGTSFIFNDDGVVKFSDYIYKTKNIQKILADFDEFERKFYEFVDSL